MLCTKDFYKRSAYNHETLEQLWCSQIGDSHDSFCGCDKPFSHLLAAIFPIGHADRNKSINQILARDYKETCHSGGGDAESHGLAGGEGAAETHIKQEGDAEGDYPGAEIEELLAAAAEEER